MSKCRCGQRVPREITDTFPMAEQSCHLDDGHHGRHRAVDSDGDVAVWPLAYTLDSRTAWFQHRWGESRDDAGLLVGYWSRQIHPEI